MSNLDIKNRIDLLRVELEKHRIAYHVNDESTISDEVYDSLMSELAGLESKHPEYDNITSPTKRVGGHILDKFEKVTHEYKQWSFDNVFNYNELYEWEIRNKKIILKRDEGSKSDRREVTFEYMCEMKIDGLKVILTYKNGELVRAATRGDGEVGENITENIKTIKSVPLILKEKIDITVVGECWLEKSELVKINKQQKENGEKEYANTRNLAAGTLRQLDPKIVAKRNLKIFAYDIELDNIENKEESLYKNKINTQEKELVFLESLGFLVNKNRKLCSDLQQVQDFYNKNVETRDSHEYGVDGMVIKINDNKTWQDLGYTAKSPRAGIAYKFPAENAATVIESVIFQVGRTGAITPVANLRPVLLAGSTVSRATLHNEDEVARLGVKVGDTVMLRKAGDVIPEIYEVLKDLRDTKIAKDIIFPKECPVCKAELSKRVVGKESGVKIFCDNVKCESKSIEGLIHFVSKKAMNIDGMGEKIIEEFYSLSLISDYASIYNLKITDIENLFGYGKKSAENIIISIEKSKNVKMKNFVYALGIYSVGETTAKELAKSFADVAALRAATQDHIMSIHDMGPVTAKNIFEYFNNEENIKKLDNSLTHITVSNPDYKLENLNRSSAKGDGILIGKTFVITGTLSNPRDYYVTKIEELGGKVSGSVSSKTSYLLAGDNAGSKFKDAESLGVEILDEKKFLSVIEI